VTNIDPRTPALFALDEVLVIDLAEDSTHKLKGDANSQARPA